MIKSATVAIGLFMLSPARASAEWQIKPFLGVTGGGGSTYTLTDAGNPPSVSFGVGAGWLGEVIGLEGDFGYGPSFFHEGLGQIDGSSVTTVTGNVVIAMPRHLTEYTLRLYLAGGAGMMRVNIEYHLDVERHLYSMPLYLVGGAGMMRVDIEGEFGGFALSERLPAMNLGGGATGFLTKRIGLNWDVRRFRSLGAIDERNSISPTGPEPFSFWRAIMAVAIRY